MKLLTRIILYLMIYLLVGLIVISLSFILMRAADGAYAQPAIPEPHDHSLYDPTCCGGADKPGGDCEPVPVDAVTEVSGGWQVKYHSPTRNINVDLFFPRAKRHDSKDGRWHVCWRVAYNTFDSKVYFSILCIYEPMNV